MKNYYHLIIYSLIWAALISLISIIILEYKAIYLVYYQIFFLFILAYIPGILLSLIINKFKNKDFS